MASLDSGVKSLSLPKQRKNVSVHSVRIVFQLVAGVWLTGSGKPAFFRLTATYFAVALRGAQGERAS